MWWYIYIYIYLFIVVYIHIICIYTYMCLYLYKHRVYLKFLQGSLSSSLELVGCLGDACRNFPCHHEGGVFHLSWILFGRGKVAKRSWRQAWSSSVAPKDSTALSCLGCRCILGTCGAEVQDVGVALRFWMIFFDRCSSNPTRKQKSHKFSDTSWVMLLYCPIQ